MRVYLYICLCVCVCVSVLRDRIRITNTKEMKRLRDNLAFDFNDTHQLNVHTDQQ